MGCCRCLYFTDNRKAEIWDRRQPGESMRSIGCGFDRNSSSIFPLLSRTCAIRPLAHTRSRPALTHCDREEISGGLGAQLSFRTIARQLRRAPWTISREVGRNGGRAEYRAARSDQAARDRALRPRLCKLACRRSLCRTRSGKLEHKWSPQQITGWLKRRHPDDEDAHVSHETIYVNLRGSLTRDQGKELADPSISRSRPTSRSTSAIPTAPGSAASTRTTTGCCDSTSPKAPTCLCTAGPNSMPWRGNSMSGKERR